MPLSQYILFFFKPIGFFDLIRLFLLVNIENNYLILCQFGYFLSRIPFLRYLNSRFWWLDLDFWLLTFRDHLGSKLFPTFEIPYITSYLTSFALSRTVLETFDFKILKIWPWPLIFRGNLKSKIFPPVESPYMPSCLTSIDTFSLSRTDFEIFDSRVFRVWSWPLTFRDHPRSKIFSPFECPYMTSYLTPIDTFSLSRTVFEIFDFKVFRVWPWPSTFRGDPRSKICSPSQSPYMPSYLTSIGTYSLSRTVFEILDFEVFRVWPWPLTFRGHPRSKIFSPFENPYMTSYLTPIDTFSLSRTVFEIFDFKVFRVWPWPLNFRGDPRSKICLPFQSPYMLSYLTLIGTFSLSRTVFEILDFKVFRVWPWPLTFRDHPRSKIFSSFECSYMTSYSTPIDTFSLSCTVFEIFDFKVFWVWPWPLTFRGHSRSKIFPLFECPYMSFYSTPIDTFSLSRTVFEIFDFKGFRVWSWPLAFRGDPRSKIFS